MKVSRQHAIYWYVMSFKYFRSHDSYSTEGLLDPTPTPYWASYPDKVRACGGKPVIVNCSLMNEFRLQPGQLTAVTQSEAAGASSTRQEIQAESCTAPRI